MIGKEFEHSPPIILQIPKWKDKAETQIVAKTKSHNENVASR